MIVYDLSCDNAHSFEGWFGSSDDFASQQDRGLLSCPVCGSDRVTKAPMAPAIGTKDRSPSGEAGVDTAAETETLSNKPMPAEVAAALKALAKAQAKALEKSEWVGGKFAETARSMHYGERDEKPIHGQATREEALGLYEEGIGVSPLLVPLAPPDELN
ncbi:MAG: DUF1178 family protein [Qipengyuania sp.]